ncbi:MAG: glycosyltransferase family 4 protein [Thermodesulfovibrionales bacterium]|nr:glycosyltransferase family 4 protein [Thermodesulfovibrionales bacterium]
MTLTILHTEASTGWGGQEIRILQESLGMIGRGHRIIIATPEESLIFKRAQNAGIKTLAAKFQKKNPISVFKMASFIDREKPDIVNTHSSADSWVASIAAKLSKTKPKIIRIRHLSTPIRKSFLSRLIYDILPDAVMTTGEEIRQRMIKDNGFDGSKIFSVPTGVDTVKFNPETVKPSLQINGFSVGMVGVLRSWKGHRYFLEAVPDILSQIPEAVFYIVGAGPQNENIKKIISELSLHEKVFMPGHREDIPEIMASLDVIVHPSYANEGVPQSVLQALAMGKALVASDAGAISEVVRDGETGLLIKPRDPKRLAETVIEFYRKPDLRVRLGENGRKLIVQNHSFEHMLDKIEKLYGSISINA